MVYVGVDLHRKRSQIAVVNETGEVLANRSVASTGADILRVLGDVAPDPRLSKVAFEATFGWGWFADLLKDAGVEAHMAHPLATKAIAHARVKHGDRCACGWDWCGCARVLRLRFTRCSPSKEWPTQPAISSASVDGRCSRSSSCRSYHSREWKPACD